MFDPRYQINKIFNVGNNLIKITEKHSKGTVLNCHQPILKYSIQPPPDDNHQLCLTPFFKLQPYIQLNPLDTQCPFNVYKTSIRRRWRCVDLLLTLKRHRVAIGKPSS